MDSFNGQALRDKVAAGYKGGNMFSNLAASPARTVVDGLPPGVTQKLHYAPTPKATIIDAWNSRRGK